MLHMSSSSERYGEFQKILPCFYPYGLTMRTSPKTQAHIRTPVSYASELPDFGSELNSLTWSTLRSSLYRSCPNKVD